MSVRLGNAATSGEQKLDGVLDPRIDPQGCLPVPAIDGDEGVANLAGLARHELDLRDIPGIIDLDVTAGKETPDMAVQTADFGALVHPRFVRLTPSGEQIVTLPAKSQVALDCELRDRHAWAWWRTRS
jgi:hypothetical protein